MVLNCPTADWTNAVVITLIPYCYILVTNSTTVLRRSLGSGPDVQGKGKGWFTNRAGGLVAQL